MIATKNFLIFLIGFPRLGCQIFVHSPLLILCKYHSLSINGNCWKHLSVCIWIFTLSILPCSVKTFTSFVHLLTPRNFLHKNQLNFSFFIYKNVSLQALIIVWSNSLHNGFCKYFFLSVVKCVYSCVYVGNIGLSKRGFWKFYSKV